MGGARAEGYLRKAMEKNFDLGKKVDYFLATGNLVSSTGMGLMQVQNGTWCTSPAVRCV